MSRIAEARTAITADGRLVLDTDPDAAFLVAGIGGVIPDEYDNRPLPGEKPERREKASPADTAEKPDGAPAPKPRKR